MGRVLWLMDPESDLVVGGWASMRRQLLGSCSSVLLHQILNARESIDTVLLLTVNLVHKRHFLDTTRQAQSIADCERSSVRPLLDIQCICKQH